MTAAPELRDWTASFARRTQTLGGGEITAILSLAGATDVITFSGGFPDPATFPRDVLGEIAAKLIATDVAVALQYSPTEGLPGLRDYVAGRLESQQGRRPAAGELMITSGGIDCMELVAKSLVDAGDVVVVEVPTYLGAIMAFRGYEADLRGVPMDDEGMRVDVLADLLATGVRPKLLYTIPDHQNPTGLSMAADRRAELVDLARRYHFLILEDVAYRELGFEDTAPPSLWSEAPDVVVQAGTFSKTFFPGVRLGWAAGPPEIITQLITAKQNSDQCSGALYARRAALMNEALRAHMPDGTTWTSPRGGFFTWVTAPDGVYTVTLSPAASARKVAYVPGQPFYPGQGGATQMRLAYSRVSDELIDEGARRLGDLVRTALEGS